MCYNFNHNINNNKKTIIIVVIYCLLLFIIMSNDTKERIKKMRALCGLTRKDMEERFNIPTNTLQCWESGRVSLTNKGAIRLASAFTEYGVDCSSDWLLSGDSSIVPIEKITQSPELEILKKHSGKSGFFQNIIYEFYGNAYLGWDLINIEDISIGVTYIVFLDHYQQTGRAGFISDKELTIECNDKKTTINLQDIRKIGKIKWIIPK